MRPKKTPDQASLALEQPFRGSRQACDFVDRVIHHAGSTSVKSPDVTRSVTIKDDGR